MNYGSIYVITNKHTQEQYVGQTIQSVARRWNAHVNTAKNPKFKLAKAISQYGVENFECVEVYNAFDKVELDRVEKEYIADLDSVYNMTKGGAGKPDKQISDRQREVASRLSSARWADPEWRQKTVLAMWGNPEVRAKRINSIKKRLAEPEVRQRYRDAQLGRKMSRSAVDKSARAKWKAIYCPEIQVSFLCSKYAAEYFGVLKTSVANAIKNKGKLLRQYSLEMVA
jgi:group I intron endonuclease